MTPEKFVQNIKEGAGWTTDEYIMNIGWIDLPEPKDQFKAMILLADQGLLFEESDEAQIASDESTSPPANQQISVDEVRRRHANLNPQITNQKIFRETQIMLHAKEGNHLRGYEYQGIFILTDSERSQLGWAVKDEQAWRFIPLSETRYGYQNLIDIGNAIKLLNVRDEVINPEVV